jgi:hypothetical protein
VEVGCGDDQAAGLGPLQLGNEVFETLVADPGAVWRYEKSLALTD